ncbi:hypothetical protein AVEN_150179-1 [Araneus ventricosus]|uniref:Uncharacterized protein n=1 Tax=Araneus ventricosus TaxID=182803 RepID=A0A4Y2J5W4_ARAVE|nr:hypothetical protein AVEN_150179-1 [Araneus ventricosus]
MRLQGFCPWTIMQDPTQQGNKRAHSSPGMGEIGSPGLHIFAYLHLFPALNSTLQLQSGRHFRSNEEVRQAVKNFLRSLGPDYYQDSFLKLISRYDKCINVGGEYEEK